MKDSFFCSSVRQAISLHLKIIWQSQQGRSECSSFSHHHKWHFFIKKTFSCWRYVLFDVCTKRPEWINKPVPLSCWKALLKCSGLCAIPSYSKPRALSRDRHWRQTTKQLFYPINSVQRTKIPFNMMVSKGNWYENISSLLRSGPNVTTSSFR